MKRISLAIILFLYLMLPTQSVIAAALPDETALIAQVENFLRETQPYGARGRDLYQQCAEVFVTYMRQSNYSAAIVWQQRQIALMEKIAPQDAEKIGLAYNQLSYLYYRNQQIPHSIMTQTKANRLFEAMSSFLGRRHLSYNYRELADACAMIGRSTEAVQWMEKAVDLAKTMGDESPSSIKELYSHTSQLFFDNKNFNLAAVWKYKEIIADRQSGQHSFKESYFDLYQIYAAQGDTKMAEKWLTAAEVEAKQVNAYSALERYAAEHSRFYQALGQPEKAAVWTRKAADFHEKNIKQQLKDIDRYRADKGSAAMEKGELLLREKAYAQAIPQFDRAIKAHPEAWRAYYSRGTAYTALGMEAQAEKDFEETVAWSENVSDAYTRIAMFYQREGKWNQSLTYYTKSIAADPDPQQCANYFNRANVYMTLKNFTAAIADADHVLSVRPNDDNMHQIKGVAYLRLGNLNEALKSYTQVIKSNPTYFNHIRRALIYYRLGQKEEGDGDVRQAFALNKEKSEAMLRRITETTKDTKQMPQ